MQKLNPYTLHPSRSRPIKRKTDEHSINSQAGAAKKPAPPAVKPQTKAVAAPRKPPPAARPPPTATKKPIPRAPTKPASPAPNTVKSVSKPAVKAPQARAVKAAPAAEAPKADNWISRTVQSKVQQAGDYAGGWVNSIADRVNGVGESIGNT